MSVADAYALVANPNPNPDPDPNPNQGMSAADAYALVASQRRITRLPTRLWGFPRPQRRGMSYVHIHTYIYI